MGEERRGEERKEGTGSGMNRLWSLSRLALIKLKRESVCGWAVGRIWGGGVRGARGREMWGVRSVRGRWRGFDDIDCVMWPRLGRVSANGSAGRSYLISF